VVVETPPLSLKLKGRPAQGRKNNQGYIRATALTAARSYCMHGSDEVLIALFLGAHSFSRGSALTACSHRSTTRPMPCCSNGNKETNRGNLSNRAERLLIILPIFNC